MTIIEIKTGSPCKWHPLQVALYLEGEPSPAVQYDEVDHRYTLDGEELPSVTTIVNPNPWSRGWATKHMDRGTLVHKACADIVSGADVSFSDALAPYIAAFRSWMAAYRPKITGSEVVIANTAHRYAGRFDMRGDVPGFDDGTGVIVYLQPSGAYSVTPLVGCDLIRAKLEAFARVRDYHDARRGDLWA